MSNFIKLPANEQSLRSRRPIYGVGINDADYITQPRLGGKQVCCPFYRRWLDMLVRCYSKNKQKSCPTYKNCTVCEEWLTFSNFKSWMETQDWEGKVLDKDILVIGNKVYSPEKCLFISHRLNTLFLDSASIRGNYPIGVSYHKEIGMYEAHCKSHNKLINLGKYNTASEASKAYIKFKMSIIEGFIEEEASSAIRDALQGWLVYFKEEYNCV